MAGGGTHKWSSAPTGSQRGTGATWRSRRGSSRANLAPSFCVLAHCSLLWDQYVQMEVRKDPQRGSTVRYQVGVRTGWES